MSVTPGSCTLWSVHSGHRCWTSRLASSTSDWNVRSSRWGAGNGMGPRLRLGGERVEGEHQVAGIVRAPDGVRDPDVHDADAVLLERDVDVLHRDARLPAVEGALHGVGGLAGRAGDG